VVALGLPTRGLGQPRGHSAVAGWQALEGNLPLYVPNSQVARAQGATIGAFTLPSNAVGVGWTDDDDPMAVYYKAAWSKNRRH